MRTHPLASTKLIKYSDLQKLFNKSFEFRLFSYIKIATSHAWKHYLCPHTCEIAYKSFVNSRVISFVCNEPDSHRVSHEALSLYEQGECIED